MSRKLALFALAVLMGNTASAGINVVHSIKLTRNTRLPKAATVRITCSEAPIFQVYAAHNPRRVVIEMLATELAAHLAANLAMVPPVTKIELERAQGAVGQVARLHFAVDEGTVYDVRTDRNVIELEVFEDGESDEIQQARQLQQQARREQETRRLIEAKTKAEADKHASEILRQRAEADRARLAVEKAQAVAAARAAEQARQIEAERRRKEESRRLAEEQRRLQAEREAARRAEEARRQADVEKQRAVAEAEKRRQEELHRQRAEQEAQHLAEAKARAEAEARRAEQDKKRAAQMAAQERAAKLRLQQEKDRAAQQARQAEIERRRLEQALAVAEAEKKRLAQQTRALQAEKQQLVQQARAATEAEKQRLTQQTRALQAEKQRLAQQARAATEAEKQRLAQQARAATEAEKQRLAQQAQAAELRNTKRPQAVSAPGASGSPFGGPSSPVKAKPIPATRTPAAVKKRPKVALGFGGASAVTHSPRFGEKRVAAVKPSTLRPAAPTYVAPSVPGLFTRIDVVPGQGSLFEDDGDAVQPREVTRIRHRVIGSESQLSLKVPGGARYSLRRVGRQRVELVLWDCVIYSLGYLRALDLRASGGPLYFISPSVEGTLRSRVVMEIEHRSGAQIYVRSSGDTLTLIAR